MKVYIASPLFNPIEREFNLFISDLFLKNGLEPYLPQRDGILIEDGYHKGEYQSSIKAAYEGDISAITSSDLLFAVLDGRTVEEGVCFEMGFAVAMNIPIVAYKSDIRIQLPWGLNPMIQCSVKTIIHDTEELVEWVKLQKS